MPLGDAVLRHRLARVEAALGRLSKARRLDPQQSQLIVMEAIADLFAVLVALSMRSE
jgi:hypothetical protein